MTVSSPDTDWLARSASADPDATAVVDDDGTGFTYGQLHELADDAAASLRETNDVLPGDVTVMAAQSVGLPLIAMLWGAWRLGAAPLLIDQRSPVVREWAQAVPGLVGVEVPDSNPDEDLHTVVLTSGSSGGPRPVRLTHANVAAAVAASRSRLGNGRDDRWLLALPLFHVGGLSVLWRCAEAGGAVVIHQEFEAARVAGALKDGSITVASLVPTMLHRILDTDPGPYRGMRAVLLGGAAASRDLVERGLEAGLPILQTYGMTETCSQIATVAPGEAVDSLGTAGPPLQGFEIDTGVAGVGEIVVSGPAVSPGYLGEADRIGGHPTGDIGYLDDNSRLVILGRADDMVITGGKNVYPAGVADVLSRHKSIERVEVVGIPDPEWGQVLAAVAVGDGVSADEIERWAQERLPRHEIPKRWTFVEEMPLLRSGKLDRVALLALAMSTP